MPRPPLYRRQVRPADKPHQLSASTSPFNDLRSCARYRPLAYGPEAAARTPAFTLAATRSQITRPGMMIANCKWSKRLSACRRESLVALPGRNCHAQSYFGTDVARPARGCRLRLAGANGRPADAGAGRRAGDGTSLVFSPVG